MSILTVFIYILLTTTISGTLGMAGGAILMAIFLIGFPLPVALILHGLIQVSSNGFRAYLNRDHIRKEIIIPYVIGAVLAYVIFAFIQVKPSKKLIFIILGLMPLLGVLKSTSIHFDIEKKGRAFICGLIVSVTQALSGVAGGVLDIFYLSSKLGRFSIVANKAFTMAIGHTIKTYYFFQIYDFKISDIPAEIYLVSIMTPLLGGLFGKKILARMNDKSFLIVAKTVMIFFSGVMLYRGMSYGGE